MKLTSHVAPSNTSASPFRQTHQLHFHPLQFCTKKRGGLELEFLSNNIIQMTEFNCVSSQSTHKKAVFQYSTAEGASVTHFPSILYSLCIWSAVHTCVSFSRFFLFVILPTGEAMHLKFPFLYWMHGFHLTQSLCLFYDFFQTVVPKMWGDRGTSTACTLTH